MSMTSSETVAYAPSKVACLFLAKFDPKAGYTLVWTRLPSGVKPDGLDFKSLPSGIHEYETTTVYLTHEWNGQLYYGLAKFQQLNVNTAGHNDRSKVRMYSLGILVECSKQTLWKPNEFATVGWEHREFMGEVLSEFIKDEDLGHIEVLYDKLTKGDTLDVPRPGANNPMVHHPLSKLPAALCVVGPLIFPIFKAALLRKRILIFNHSSQGGDLILGGNNREPELCGALAYIVALVSIVPKDVRLEPLEQHHLYSQPLYNIGLHDLDSNVMEHHVGAIACTSDEVLKYQKNLYDYAVVMPSTDSDTCQFLSSSDLDNPIRATFNDYMKFLKVFRQLPQSRTDATADDSLSIRTSNSIFSSLRFDIHGENANIKLDHEPAWWLDDATSPMSWREYIWLAFAWFASAGTTNTPTSATFSEETPMEESRESVRQLLVTFTAIVGHFHKLTKKWFYVIDEIVSETAEGKLPLQTHVTLELTHQDIVDMELDPYLHEDVKFVREFVLLYWDSVVNDVEVGMGIQGLCC